MSKFKIGDKVVRQAGGNFEEFVSIQGIKDYYTVTSISAGGYWLQVDGAHYKFDPHPWCRDNFELYQEPEDYELPPVPSSVTYMNTKRDPGNDQRLVLERDSEYDEGLLSITIIPRKDSTWAQEIGINMSPDAALQLAHDLRRMAMEVKRKEKAQ